VFSVRGQYCRVEEGGDCQCGWYYCRPAALRYCRSTKRSVGGSGGLSPPNVEKAVTRADLCEAVYRKVGVSRSESAALVELVFKEITGDVLA
jgi:hypothetical protein